jgi:hypothetical protein
MQKSYNFLEHKLKTEISIWKWDLDSILLIWLWKWLQMEKFELQSCRSRWKLEFSYKVYLQQNSNKNIKFFWKTDWTLPPWPTAAYRSLHVDFLCWKDSVVEPNHSSKVFCNKAKATCMTVKTTDVSTTARRKREVTANLLACQKAKGCVCSHRAEALKRPFHAPKAL